MCDKAVNNYAHALELVPDCHKVQKYAIKPSNVTISFVLECYQTQEMYDKAVNTCFFVLHLVPHRYKTQEMCKKVVSEDPFMLIYCLDRYKTQKMCDEAVDDCLGALKFIPHWFVTSEMLEKFHDALLADNEIFFFDEEFSKLTFFVNEMGILTVEPDKIKLCGDNNFYEDDPEAIIQTDFWLSVINLKMQRI